MKTNTKPRVPVGVVGATGYTGLEVMELLAGHPGVEVRFATSRSGAGNASAIAGVSLSAPDEVDPGSVEVVFLCLPHGEARKWMEGPGRAVPRVVDLTADHRPGSGSEEGWVYGLPEVDPAAVSQARRVANPGCYPTGVILALEPLHRGGLVDSDRTVVVNAASGVTGAGRSPRTDLLFAEVYGDFRAYSPGNRHRHLKEMNALLPGLPLLFTPHLLPVPRGILETIALPVPPGVGAEDVLGAWHARYGGSRVVRIFPEAPPSLASVVRSDRLHLAVWENAGLEGSPTLTVSAALDNLGKGAAGQAVQNMNLMLGYPAEQGVRC